MLSRRNMSSSLSSLPQHIAIFGATGGTGLALIKQHLAMPDSPSKPYLTLYTRSSGRSKLSTLLPQSTTSSIPASRIRIVQGELTDQSTIRTALSASTPDFPKVTAVLSLLGSYVSLNYFLTRRTPTPLANALSQTIIPTMKSLDIRRILVFSTATAYRLPLEASQMSWSWWLFNLFPRFVVPQGNAEMREIGKAVLENHVDGDAETGLSEKEGLDATVVRLPPVMSAKGANLEVLAFERLGGKGGSESKEVSKASLAKWILREVEDGKWIGRAPVVVNTLGK